MTYDAGPALSTVHRALVGPYAFLVDDLGFVPDGEIETRENRPGNDAWQVLRRGDLVVTLAVRGDLVSRDAQLEVSPDGSVWTLGTAFGLDLAEHAEDPVALARLVMPLLVQHADREGPEATSGLVATAHEQLRAVTDVRRRVCEDVEKRWRQAWPELDVVLGVRDDAPFTRAVRGVSTRSGVVAETVLDWVAGTAFTRLRLVDDSASQDLRDLLLGIGASDDAEALDRAAGRADPQLPTARLGIRVVRDRWSVLGDHLRTRR